MSYHVHSEGVDGRACGGVSVLVKKSIPHRQITLNTNLQAVAVVLSLHKTRPGLAKSERAEKWS